MQIPATVPVIGPVLARRSAAKTARAARGGDTAAVRELCYLLVDSGDREVRETARSALRVLSSGEMIDTFCGWIMSDGDLHPLLVEIAIDREYAPTGMPARALFYAATGQNDCLAAIDSGPAYPNLAEGYRQADPLTRKRVLLAAGKDTTGSGHILAHAIMGDPAGRETGTWSRAEWETVLTGLAGEQDWDTLWPLLFSAPPSLAVRYLHILHDGEWKPPVPDRRLFNDLVTALPPIWEYPLPEDPDGLTLACPDRQCLEMIFSRDGSLLAAAHSDGSIAVFQCTSGRLLARWRDGEGLVEDQVILPDSGSLVYLNDDGVLRCRHIPDGTVRWSYDDPLHRITTIVHAVNGAYLLAGNSGGGVSLIDCSTGNVADGVTGHNSPVTALTGAPDGNSVACGHRDGTIRCWDRRTNVTRGIAPGTGDAVLDLAFSSDSTLLFVLPGHAQPAIQDVTTGDCVRTCTGFSGTPLDHAISLGSHRALVWDSSNILRLWQWTGPHPCISIPFYNRHPGCCALSPDGTLCVAGCDDGTIRIFTSQDGRLLRDFRGHTRPVSACAISPDSSLLATAAWDGTITLRDLPSGEIRRTLERPAGPVTALGITPGGSVLIAVTADGIARQYNRDGGALLRSIDLYVPSVKTIAISPDGKYLASAGSDASLRLWDLATGSLVAGREQLGTTLRSLAFSPDGTLLVSGGWDSRVKYWRVPDLHPVGTGTGHSSTVTCCAITPDGSRLVTGSNDTSVRIWSLGAGRPSTVIRDAGTEVSACTILSDGALVATGSSDGEIRVYRLPDGRPECTIPVIPGRITALTCSQDGELLIAGYENGSLAFCSLSERRLVRVLPVHAAAITGIVPVPDGEHVATGGMDGMVRLTRLPWTKNLSQAAIDDMPWVYGETTGDNETMRSQWIFLYQMLAGRFRGEIGICSPSREAGPFDIQIAG
jgi:WD40 repeat protein